MTDNQDFISILVLSNLVEADLMGAILTDENIPYYIREWHDANYDTLFSMEKGYGWLMASRGNEQRILDIYRERIGREPEKPE